MKRVPSSLFLLPLFGISVVSNSSLLCCNINYCIFNFNTCFYTVRTVTEHNLLRRQLDEFTGVNPKQSTALAILCEIQHAFFLPCCVVTYCNQSSAVHSYIISFNTSNTVRGRPPSYCTHTRTHKSSPI